MSAGVFTPNLRFQFVKGWLTGGTDPADGSVECGDGTLYPMEVTLDQIAEIFYRVRDSVISGGSVAGDYSGVVNKGYTYSGTVSLQFKGGTRPARMAEETTGISFTRLSGFAQTNGSLRNSRAAQCLDISGTHTAYASDLGGRFGDLYHINVSGSGEQARDPLNEYSMWTKSRSGFPFRAPLDLTLLGDYTPSGMSFYSSAAMPGGSTSDIADSWYGFSSSNYYHQRLNNPPNTVNESNYYDAGLCVVTVIPEVAFTGEHLLDPAGSLYLRLTCRLSGRYRITPTSSSATFGLQTHNEVGDPDFETTSVRLRMVLGDTEISCPLYWWTFFDGGALNKGALTDLVITATEWWPYAKDSPAVPVWDTTNGAKL